MWPKDFATSTHISLRNATDDNIAHDFRCMNVTAHSLSCPVIQLNDDRPLTLNTQYRSITMKMSINKLNFHAEPSLTALLVHTEISYTFSKHLVKWQ